MRVFFRKWLAFLRPRSGWLAQYRQALAGRNVWEVPNRPECPKLIPWPLDWIPHRLTTAEDPIDDFSRGWVDKEEVCVDTGKIVSSATMGCRCCRCGVPLHPTVAYPLFGGPGYNAPFCSRCWYWTLPVR